MRIKEEYIKKYWYNIVLDQLIDDYKSRGYEILDHKLLGNIQPDLCVRKDDQLEIITVSSTKLNKDEFLNLHKYAQKHDIKFKVVVSNYSPFYERLDIDNFEYALVSYLNGSLPDSISELGYCQRIEDITDVEYTKAHILEGGKVHVEGNGTCEVTIEIDDEGDIEHIYYFPIMFNLYIEWKSGYLTISEESIDIETSKYYE